VEEERDSDITWREQHSIFVVPLSFCLLFINSNLAENFFNKVTKEESNKRESRRETNTGK
jgi:regulatory protein YycI of two-component signal transduction system YycFG